MLMQKKFIVDRKLTPGKVYDVKKMKQKSFILSLITVTALAASEKIILKNVNQIN